MLSLALRSTPVMALHSGHQVTKGRFSGLVLLAHWHVLVLSVNAFATAGLSIVYGQCHVRIPLYPKTRYSMKRERPRRGRGEAFTCSSLHGLKNAPTRPLE